MTPTQIENLNHSQIDHNLNHSYSEIETLPATQKIISNKLLFHHWNCNSIKNKELELKQFLEHNKSDFLSLNEIKCSTAWANELLNIDGYFTVAKCRNNRGGGVALLIKDNIEFSKNDIDVKFEEIIGINCKIDQTNISVFSYYNPSNKKINQEIFNHIEANYTDYFIMGDFNAKCEMFGRNRSNENGKILEEVLLNNKCQILNENYDPTFHIIKQDKENYGELLDLFIGSPLIANLASNYKIIDTDFDSAQLTMYHSVIEICLKNRIEYPQITKSTKQNSYLYELANWREFSKSLEEITPNTQLNLIDTLNFINENIDKAASRNIPKAKTHLQTKRALPRYILDSIKERNRLQSKYKKKT